jgi:hypothetical protein
LKIIATLVGLCLISFNLVGCGNYKPTAEEKDQAETDKIMNDLGQTQKIPKISYSQTRASLIKILELEGKATATWTVERSMDGRILTIFPSIGYPIPGGTSLTNPQQLTCRAYSSTSASNSCSTIGQAEPTGVFPPTTSEGTRVIQVMPDGSKVVFYSEGKLSTYAYPVKQTDAYTIVPAGSAPSSSKIEFKTK